MPMPKCTEREISWLLGLKTYFTGKPCKYGHVAERNTCDFSCVDCRGNYREAHGREWGRNHARQKRAAMSPEERGAARIEWAVYQRSARLRDPEKFRARERKHGRLKRQRHPQRKLADTRARQLALIKRTPPWSDIKAIRRFYESCPPGCTVDHIIPVRGRGVSGLHVLENLQYLSKTANLIKNNTFDPAWINDDGTWNLPDWEPEMRVAA
jgi:hypothetical protein